LGSTIEYKDGNISVEEWVNEFTRDVREDAPVNKRLREALEKSKKANRSLE
jgi:hypothetical protein